MIPLMWNVQSMEIQSQNIDEWVPEAQVTQVQSDW